MLLANACHAASVAVVYLLHHAMSKSLSVTLPCLLQRGAPLAGNLFRRFEGVCLLYEFVNATVGQAWLPVSYGVVAVQ